MSSTTPLDAFPTLMNVPSFSVPAEVAKVTAATAPIPAATAKDLADLIDHAGAISTEEATVAHSLGLQLPYASFHDDDDDTVDPDLEEYLAPKSAKGKAKAPAPATAPTSPATAGPSSTLHPFL
jgi:hypothetical protein